MSAHKFKIGQLVNYHGRERAPGVYQITQLLPPEGDTVNCPSWMRRSFWTIRASK
jgi:hypothetical protein